MFAFERPFTNNVANFAAKVSLLKKIIKTCLYYASCPHPPFDGLLAAGELK